jgi:hypothetical protein
MTTPRGKSPEEILRQDSYAPDDLARLLDMDIYVIRSAVRRGDLKAVRVGQDIVEIRREDALKWLAERG